MASVSLIVPIAPGSAHVLGHMIGLYESLSAAGHAVEVLAIAGPESAAVLGDADLGPPVRKLVTELPGKAASAYHGLGEAAGELLVIVDLEKGYTPEDVGRVIEPLIRGEADVVVAANSGEPRHDAAGPAQAGRARGGRARRIVAAVARPLIGITDLSSGLVAVTRTSYQARIHHPAPLGSRFVLELLVGAVGRRIEVPIRGRFVPRRFKLRRSDLRLIKRLADDRFGNVSRLVQFCVVGASGMFIDLTCYALFQLVLSRTVLVRMRTPLLGAGQSLDLAVAAALAIAIALVWNFSLNRRLTFNDARRGSILRQFVTYVLGNALGIALSYSLRLILPSKFGFFDRHKLAAAVVGIVAATGISFSMSRWVVFSRQTPAPKHGRQALRNSAALAERL